MKTATFVSLLKSEKGKEQRLFKCDPPMQYEKWTKFDENENENGDLYGFVKREAEYVVVSAISNKYAIETFIFASDKDGEITYWIELPGSYSGDVDISKALWDAGYTPVYN